MKQLFIAALFLFLVTGGLAIDCPPTKLVDPNAIEFDYDPNQVNYKLICVIEVEDGQQITKRITACDPDGDPMSFALLNAPESMVLSPMPDANEVDLSWTALVGTYYVDVVVVDQPPVAETFLEDRASMIFKVYPKNKSPIFTRCNGDLDGNSKIDFNDFAIFASYWPIRTNAN